MNIGFFAIGLANLSRAEILAAAATTAERVGFSTLWAGEHIVFVETIRSEYPYARTTTAPPVPTNLPILNPFVALSYAAELLNREWHAVTALAMPLIEFNELRPGSKRTSRAAENGLRVRASLNVCGNHCC
jgi:alkanesulfonate monooxygenase SsuD/methylene tetrahydromethanopterin reductase-like flavin-dependent oxidoreductase (luciferase family)